MFSKKSYGSSMGWGSDKTKKHGSELAKLFAKTFIVPWGASEQENFGSGEKEKQTSEQKRLFESNVCYV